MLLYATPPQHIEEAFPKNLIVEQYKMVSSSVTISQGDLELLREQAWFSSEEWQIGEREASEQIAAGDTVFYGSDEEFLASL